MPGEDLIGAASQIQSNLMGKIEGTIQLLSAKKKEREDRAALKKLERPFYQIQDEYNQNRNIAAGEVAGGIPAGIEDYYTQQSQRGLGAGISGTLQSGGNPNDIAKLFDIYDTGIDRSYAQSAEQHLKNIQYFKDANKDLAGQLTTKWAIDKYQPYQNRLKQLTQNIAADEQNQYNGLNSIIGATSAQGTALQNNQLLNNLFSTGGGTGGGGGDDGFSISQLRTGM